MFFLLTRRLIVQVLRHIYRISPPHSALDQYGFNAKMALAILERGGISGVLLKS